MNQNLYSIREVAHILRVQQYQIAYLLTTGKVPEPQTRLGNRRAFSVDDIERLAKCLNVALPKTFTQEDQDV
jgi:DNA-binding transcriptional MerR regulator